MDNQNEYPIVLSEVAPNTVEFINDLPVPWSGADQCLVKKGDRYFVVSTNDTFGFETLVFPSDSEGNITEYIPVAGGYDITREEAIEDLANTDVESVEIDNG